MKTINTYINEKLRLTTKHKYTCQPKSKGELQRIIMGRIEEEGNDCDLNDIDTSKMTDMGLLFDASAFEIFKDFNGDISQWDVSNVENMDFMFFMCEKFNCDLSRWDVSNVIHMYKIFYNCEKLNCDLSKWNVSKVNDMHWAFFRCPTQPEWYDKDKWED